METKKCNRCLEIKKASEFRLRKQKSKNSNNIYYYLNSNCRICDKERAAEYRNKNKGNTEYKERIKNYSKEYRNKNKEYFKLVNKEYMKEFRLRNKERLSKLHKISAKKHFEYQRDNLTDSYIINLMMSQSSLTRKDLLEYPQLIEAKRQQIKLKRLTD